MTDEATGVRGWWVGWAVEGGFEGLAVHLPDADVGFFGTDCEEVVVV